MVTANPPLARPMWSPRMFVLTLLMSPTRKGATATTTTTVSPTNSKFQVTNRLFAEIVSLLSWSAHTIASSLRRKLPSSRRVIYRFFRYHHILQHWIQLHEYSIYTMSVSLMHPIRVSGSVMSWLSAFSLSQIKVVDGFKCIKSLIKMLILTQVAN